MSQARRFQWMTGENAAALLAPRSAPLQRSGTSEIFSLWLVDQDHDGEAQTGEYRAEVLFSFIQLTFDSAVHFASLIVLLFIGTRHICLFSVPRALEYAWIATIGVDTLSHADLQPPP